MSWVNYWNGTPSLYVCARHKEAHDFDIAFSIVRHLPRDQARVLDFGCGEATRAKYVSSRCSQLYLWDAAPAVRDRLSRRYAKDQRITVVSEDQLRTFSTGSLDLVVMSSVVQYIAPADLALYLADIHRWLSPSGCLIIADVIPKDVSILKDALELLSFAKQERFFCKAVSGLARTALSSYWSTRARLRLTKFNEHEFLGLLHAYNFDASRLERNFGHNQRRMAFSAVPTAPAQFNPVASKHAGTSDVFESAA